MDIQATTSTASTSLESSCKLLPRRQFSAQQTQIVQAAQRLNRQWGSSPCNNPLSSLFTQWLGMIKGPGQQPPHTSPIQPMYGVVLPPENQGVENPPEDDSTIIAIYGAVLPPKQ